MCKHCNKEKSVKSFSWNNKKMGWRSHTCLDCYNQQQRDKRERYPERYKEARKRYYKKNRQIILDKIASYREQNSIKRYAQKIVEYAVKRGDIKKKTCEICGGKETEAHHDDYSKPLNIKWVCRKCHRRIHGKYAKKIVYNTVK